MCIHLCNSLGIKLGLKHITICSAAVYFHKFYKHVDTTAYDNYVSIYSLHNLLFYFKVVTIHPNYSEIYHPKFILEVKYKLM